MMQHDNRREMLDAVALTADELGETPIGPREIADEGCRASFGDMGKLDQRPRPRTAGAEPRGKPDRKQGYPESDPHRATPNSDFVDEDAECAWMTRLSKAGEGLIAGRHPSRRCP